MFIIILFFLHMSIQFHSTEKLEKNPLLNFQSCLNVFGLYLNSTYQNISVVYLPLVIYIYAIFHFKALSMVDFVYIV